MKIQSHFNLGDRAYYVSSKYKNLFMECPSCLRGFIPLKNGDKIECPQCKGKGVVAERSINYYMVSQNVLTVGQIRFEISNNKFEESYMCEESGVGSGNVYPLFSLYRTQELAQAECDRLNNQEPIQWGCTFCNKKYENARHDEIEYRHCEIHGSSRHVNIKKIEDRLAKEVKEDEFI